MAGPRYGVIAAIRGDAEVVSDRDLLSGLVEVDETYVGGEEKGVHGRFTEKKAIVAIALELHERRGYGRVRIRQIADVHPAAASLVPFVCEAITPGSTVKTDGWTSCRTITKHGYVHEPTNIRASGDPAHVVMPGVHRIASLLKRWLLGTHQGAVRPKHLDAYLDEYTFRFNHRTSRARGLLFHRLLEQAVQTPPTPYKNIIA